MNFKLIDTHCHVHFEAYKNDMDEVIKRATNQDIAMITVGTQSDTSKKAIEVAEKYDGVWASVGLHPNHIHKQEFFDDSELSADEVSKIRTRAEVFDLDFYRELASHPKVVAIGEFGLDYYHLPPEVKKEQMVKDQIKTAKSQLKLASEIKKPIIVHCRNAHSDQYNILKDEIDEGGLSARGVLHCFTGTLEDAQKYIDLGFMISVTGILNFSKDLQKIVKELPLNSLMVETDSPYLTPPPYRGKRNEPSYVRFVAEVLAEIKEKSFDEIVEITSENAKRLFGI